jgi:hypothetical protein
MATSSHADARVINEPPTRLPPDTKSKVPSIEHKKSPHYPINQSNNTKIIMKITGALILLSSGATAFQPLVNKGNSRVSPVFSYLSSLGQVAPLGSTQQNNDIATRGSDVSITKNDFFARRADEDRTVS